MNQLTPEEIKAKYGAFMQDGPVVNTQLATSSQGKPATRPGARAALATKTALYGIPLSLLCFGGPGFGFGLGFTIAKLQEFKKKGLNFKDGLKDWAQEMAIKASGGEAAWVKLDPMEQKARQDIAYNSSLMGSALGAGTVLLFGPGIFAGCKIGEAIIRMRGQPKAGANDNAANISAQATAPANPPTPPPQAKP